MNRLAVLFVISLLVGVAMSQFPITIPGSGNRFINKVYTVKDPLVVPANLDNNGEITVTVTATTTVLVCINEQIQVTSGINSCSPGGLLNFTWNTTSLASRERSFFGGAKTDVMTKKIYLRFSKNYFISYQFIWDNPNTNDSTVEIKIDGKTCGAPIQIGPNCGKETNTFLLEAGKGLEKKITSGQVMYFYFVSTKQYNYTDTTLTGINRTRDHILFYERRGAYPLFLNENPVPGSFDLAGDDMEENMTNIHLNFPKPDTFWFTVASNDSNDITFTITHNLGGEASVGDMHAKMPEFGKTADNNSIEYAAATTNGISFTYFRFDTNDLKLGVAPKDDSDGSPDVFADIGFVPSADSNLIANTNSTEEAHLISATTTPTSNGFFWYTFHVDAQKEVDTTWYVAINSTNAFVIWDASIGGGCANNCSGRGTCDETRGLCICDDGYERYDCSDKVFPLVWIILIAIGGAILLAIAIGVPVSCYVKNKKKSGYERV